MIFNFFQNNSSICFIALNYVIRVRNYFRNAVHKPFIVSGMALCNMYHSFICDNNFSTGNIVRNAAVFLYINISHRLHRWTSPISDCFLRFQYITGICISSSNP